MYFTWVVSGESHHSAAFRETISLHKVGGDGALQDRKENGVKGHLAAAAEPNPYGPVSPAPRRRVEALPIFGPSVERWHPGRSQTSFCS